MYKPYYIQVDESFKNLIETSYREETSFEKEYLKILKDKKDKIISVLAIESQHQLLLEKGKGNCNFKATQIQDDWFPEIEADVFISHSHQDIEIVEKFAAWLNNNFGLKCFIDYDVWEYAKDLQKELDNKYTKIDDSLYDYEKRNNVAVHVYIILVHALTQMINKTECFFFLETENSVIDPRTAAKETASPWLFHELAVVDTIKTRKPPKRKGDFSPTLATASESIQISYDMPTNRLIKIGVDNLKAWQDKKPPKSSKSLDTLYNLTNP